MKTIIVAMDHNNAIGFNNDLPWGRSLKDDLANFKKQTSGASIIMGRKTFESVGSKPLPQRENIVVSRTPTGVPGVLTAVSLESAYSLARYPIFIIGGGQIYAAALADADRLMVTMVDGEFPEATVYFPGINPAEWKEVSRERFSKDERNEYSFDIVVFERAA
jgi:dihydrofolate reductase